MEHCLRTILLHLPDATVTQILMFGPLPPTHDGGEIGGHMAVLALGGGESSDLSDAAARPSAGRRGARLSDEITMTPQSDG